LLFEFGSLLIKWLCGQADYLVEKLIDSAALGTIELSTGLLKFRAFSPM
jgi:hypothetical protein